jgi:hypothetical protein
MPTKPPVKIKYSVQEIQNLGFDEDYLVPVVEIMGGDGQNLQRLNASNLAIRIEYDGSGNPIYLGLASPGSLVSEEKWQIRKLTFDGSGNLTAMEYAGGVPNFSYIWDNRTGLSYS